MMTARLLFTARRSLAALAWSLVAFALCLGVAVKYAASEPLLTLSTMTVGAPVLWYPLAIGGVVTLFLAGVSILIAVDRIGTRIDLTDTHFEYRRRGRLVWRLERADIDEVGYNESVLGAILSYADVSIVTTHGRVVTVRAVRRALGLVDAFERSAPRRAAVEFSRAAR